MVSTLGQLIDLDFLGYGQDFELGMAFAPQDVNVFGIDTMTLSNR